MERLRARLREALAGIDRVPAPPHPPSSGAPVGEDLVLAFRAALVRAQGSTHAIARTEDLPAWLAETFPAARIARCEDAPDEVLLREADVGVDRADLLIAETGTVVRTYASRTASRLSLIPPATVFTATPGQIVRDLPTALAHIAERHHEGRAYTVLITGPSRTADIEKQLVIPAHGPRRLDVVLVGTELD